MQLPAAGLLNLPSAAEIGQRNGSLNNSLFCSLPLKAWHSAAGRWGNGADPQQGRAGGRGPGAVARVLLHTAARPGGRTTLHKERGLVPSSERPPLPSSGGLLGTGALAQSGASQPRATPLPHGNTPGLAWQGISYSHLAKNLDLVSQYVKENKGKIISFEEQQHFQLHICDLDETFYEGQLDMLEYREALYLPEPTEMVVLGTVDDMPCLATGQPLVILVAGDSSVYAYEEELLHRVGKPLQEFLKKGLRLFGQEVYPCAQGLEPESEEEWAKDPEIQQIRQSTSDFIQSEVQAFGKHLDFLSSLG